MWILSETTRRVIVVVMLRDPEATDQPENWPNDIRIGGRRFGLGGRSVQRELKSFPIAPRRAAHRAADTPWME
jgi:hypothetical protein